MTRAPKFYKPTKPVVRNQAAVDRHCAEIADDLKALSAEIPRKRAIAKKPLIESETESPDVGEREVQA